MPKPQSIRLSRWGWRVLPVWTFFFGLLVGGLPGGITVPSNLLVLAIYIVITLAIWVPLEVISRKAERSNDSVDTRT